MGCAWICYIYFPGNFGRLDLFSPPQDSRLGKNQDKSRPPVLPSHIRSSGRTMSLRSETNIRVSQRCKSKSLSFFSTMRSSLDVFELRREDMWNLCRQHTLLKDQGKSCELSLNESTAKISLWLDYPKLNPPAPVGAKGRVFPEALATGSFSWGGGPLIMQVKRMVRS